MSNVVILQHCADHGWEEGFNVWRGSMFIESCVYKKGRAEFWLVIGFSGSCVIMWPLEVMTGAKTTFFALRAGFEEGPSHAVRPHVMAITSWAQWRAVPTSAASPLHVALELKRTRGQIPRGILLKQTGKEREVLEQAADFGFRGVPDKVLQALACDLEMADPPCGRIPLIAALAKNVLGCGPADLELILEKGLDEVLEPSKLLEEADLDSALLPEDRAEATRDAVDREDKLAELKRRCAVIGLGVRCQNRLQSQ